MMSPPQGYVASSVIPQELWFDVRDYGAVGNGVADDTVPIQAALNAVPTTGAIVFIPANTYKITAALSVKSFTHVLGVRSGTLGASGGSILAVTGAPAAAIQNSDQVGGNSGIVLDSFVIQGGSPAAGINLVKVKNSIITDVYVNQTTAEGIRLNLGQINWVVRCFLQNIGTDGISLIAESDDFVEGNQITATNNGISATVSGGNSMIRNNFCFLCGANGILSQARNTIIGNRCNNNGTTNGSGINVSGANGASSIIMGNHCYDNGVAAAGPRDGIIIDTTDVLVIGNRCLDDGPATQISGIHLSTSADYCTVSDNDVRGNITNAVRIDGVLTHNVIRGNVGFNPGFGSPGIMAEADLFDQTANVASIATFTPAVEGTFRITAYINNDVAIVGAILQVSYTDHDAVAQTDAIPLIRESTGVVSAGTFTTTDRYFGNIMIRAGAAAITVKTVSYVSGTYDISAAIEQLA